jgi:2-phospho-L-lactate/phosphoenolpyruvate guanylyltransferase
VTLPNLAIIVAVGPLDRAKSRLGPTLDAAERRSLVLAMLDDVLRAIRESHSGDLFVVTPDEDLAPLLAPHGAITLRDEGQGTNAAIVTALSNSDVAAADAALILQGDLPQITAAHVDAMQAALAALPASSAFLVPNDDGGTSALGLRPPSAMPTAFGSDSGARHRESAANTGIPIEQFPIPDLASDVDTIEDLRRVSQIAGPATTALLAQLGVAAR